MKIVSALLLLFGLCGCDGRKDFVVASKNFSEQVLLGEIVAQQIEKNCGVAVERKLNLGGTFICHKALVAGEIDAYVEYTGTALTAILKLDPIADADEVYRKVKAAYEREFNLMWTEPLGFNNTFAIIIRTTDAKRLGVRTISDVAKHAPQWRAGFGYEFMERKDGFPGLAALYGLKFREQPRVMDLTLTYKAVADKQVDFIAGNSTDGLISRFDLFVLEDDKHYFPPYHAAPVVRSESLQENPCINQQLSRLGGKINDEQMRRMNYLVDVEHRDVKGVAADFLNTLIGTK